MMVKVDTEDQDDEQLVRVRLEDVLNLSIAKFEVQAKNHVLKEIKYMDSCVMVYSWIWTLCTRATQDKLKTVPGFADIERAKKFIQPIMAIKGITLQFKSNKDLSTALMRSLSCIFKCRQGPT